MKKKILMKIIATLCAVSATLTTPGLVSANPQKKLLGRKTNRENFSTDEMEMTENNQNADQIADQNEIVENNQNAGQIANEIEIVDADKMYTKIEAINENIIDQNSEDEKNKERNEIRKLVNDKFVKELLQIMDDEPAQIVLLDLRPSNFLQRFAEANVKNKFDKFMYQQIARLDRFPNMLDRVEDEDDDSENENNISKIKNEKNIKFNFLSTKITIGNMLIKNEKDLIKQFMMKFACQDMLKICDPVDLSEQCREPYDCKEVMEKAYLKCLKLYHHNDNIEYDVNANNLQDRKEAYETALFDAENKKETVLNQKNEVFKKTYYQTYALANAEIDAKAYKGRQIRKILDKNMQKFYDDIYNNQYNEVIKQIGVHDGIEPISRKIYGSDPIASKNYDEGYLIGVRKKARETVCCYELKYKGLYKWDQAQKAYFEYFTEALYEQGFILFSELYPAGLGLDEEHWQEFLQPDDNDSQDIVNFKENAKKRYIEGCLKGCEERGFKYAHSKEGSGDRKKYEFDRCFEKKQSKTDEFYKPCKQAYENGLQKGLEDINKNVKE